MKNSIIIISALFLFVCCDTNDGNIPKSITQFQWKLISMETSEKLLEPNLGNYHNARSYILDFLDKTTFQLNTGVNMAKGNYSLAPNNNISISNYHGYTEVAATRPEEREFNELQIKLFPKTSAYKINGNRLIITGPEIEFVFQQMSKKK